MSDPLAGLVALIYETLLSSFVFSFSRIAHAGEVRSTHAEVFSRSFVWTLRVRFSFVKGKKRRNNSLLVTPGKNDEAAAWGLAAGDGPLGAFGAWTTRQVRVCGYASFLFPSLLSPFSIPYGFVSRVLFLL